MTDIHDTADLVSKALRRAWQLGQTYWQQADSEYQSHWKKAVATQNEFDRLEEDTRAAILTANSIAQPAPIIPDDVMRDARRYMWLRNAALDWYVGPEYSTYNDVVCAGVCCNLAGGGVALDSTIDALLAAAPKPEE